MTYEQSFFLKGKFSDTPGDPIRSDDPPGDPVPRPHQHLHHHHRQLSQRRR